MVPGYLFATLRASAAVFHSVSLIGCITCYSMGKVVANGSCAGHHQKHVSRYLRCVGDFMWGSLHFIMRQGAPS